MVRKWSVVLSSAFATSALVGMVVMPGSTASASSTLRVNLAVVVSGLNAPVAIAARATDSTLYIAEQHTGQVRAVTGGTLSPTPVLDIGADISLGGEQGLLGLAFGPDGTKLYVDYTDTAGNTQVDEFAMTVTGVADMASRRNLLSVTQPFSNHNGGQLALGPDGMLYIALGDGGSGGDPFGNAQNKATLLGKILRIDPAPSGALQYSIPSDNPFVGDPLARHEIWDFGLRNPWRFSFDQLNGDLWTADVGQNVVEEIDYSPVGTGGFNFGWNLREGRRPYNGGHQPHGAINPIFSYTHTAGGCAVIGGFRYRGVAIPALVGKYVYSDFCLGKLMAFTPNSTFKSGSSKWLHATVASPTSFGQDNTGELYVLAGGTLDRITA